MFCRLKQPRKGTLVYRPLNTKSKGQAAVGRRSLSCWVQGLRIHSPVPRTWVQSLGGREDFTCHRGATKLGGHNYSAWGFLDKGSQASHLESSPPLHRNLRKPTQQRRASIAKNKVTDFLTKLSKQLQRCSGWFRGQYTVQQVSAYKRRNGL